jgi:type II secretory pathway pseudopilin PulG
MITTRKNSSKRIQVSLRAFTLVETLVAITIIMIVIVAPFTTAEKSLYASQTARDELKAASIAQEGIEYVRGVRDNNYLYNTTHPGATHEWLYGIDYPYDGTPSGSTSCLTPNKCVVDFGQQTASQCSAGNCSSTPLYVNSNFLFTQVSLNNTPARFYRSVQFCYVNGSSCSNTMVSNEAQFTVTVSWTSNSGPRTVTVVEYLTNWL